MSAVFGRLGGVLEYLESVWGPFGNLLEASWRLLGASWASWRRPGGVLEPLAGVQGGSWGVLGASGLVLGASWGVLGASLRVSGASWGPFGASWEPLGGLLGASWEPPGASWGERVAAINMIAATRSSGDGPGPILGGF